jgi:hypothetical protein
MFQLYPFYYKRIKIFCQRWTFPLYERALARAGALDFASLPNVTPISLLIVSSLSLLSYTVGHTRFCYKATPSLRQKTRQCRRPLSSTLSFARSPLRSGWPSSIRSQESYTCSRSLEKGFACTFCSTDRCVRCALFPSSGLIQIFFFFFFFLFFSSHLVLLSRARLISYAHHHRRRVSVVRPSPVVPRL